MTTHIVGAILAVVGGFLLTIVLWAAEPTEPPTPADPSPQFGRLTDCTADALLGVFCCTGTLKHLADAPVTIRLDALYRCGEDPTVVHTAGAVTGTPVNGVLEGELCTVPITNEACPEPLTFGWLGQLVVEQPAGVVVLTGYGERLF